MIGRQWDKTVQRVFELIKLFKTVFVQRDEIGAYKLNVLNLGKKALKMLLLSYFHCVVSLGKAELNIHDQTPPMT